jgi:hypothetical protein
MACELQNALAGHRSGLHLQRLATDARPGKAGDNANRVRTERFAPLILARPEPLGHPRVGEANACFAFRNLAGGLPADACDDPLQFAHARFAGVAADQSLHRAFGNAQVRFFQPVLFQLLGQQMPPRDLLFFIEEIARHLDDLHTV